MKSLSTTVINVVYKNKMRSYFSKNFSTKAQMEDFFKENPNYTIISINEIPK